MSEDATTQLATLTANNTADAAALAALEADLNTPATQSVGDQVFAAVEPVLTTVGLVEVFGADTLSNALTAAGYTVTAPATDIPVTDGTSDTPS
jgi:hypothetical protein